MNKTIFFVILLILVTISITILIRSHHQDILLQGEVDAPQVNISSKAKGRVVNIAVNRGDDVKAGDKLITLDSPELLAQVKAAEAKRDQAKLQFTLSEKGTREESVRYYQALLAEAKAAYDNARKEYDRYLAIANKDFISQSMLDSANKSKNENYQKMLSAQANLDQALHGDRLEQKEIYAAQLEQTEQELNALLIQYDDLQVKAPVDGEIGAIPAEVGELFNISSPLMTIIRLPEAYFIFNLREDIMANIHKGQHVKLTVPALGQKVIEAEIRYIAAMGDFATKRATRATGDFDLKTFEVRLYPLQPVEGLRPGMSTLWQWHK
ncbi:HlyD family secretion protein [Candidatus Schmidhempelia bombi]|uniref:Biotin/lipoyl-binding protein n=1 Tax=Candidatus Schmidhempelia bombi str. Bimp TaxID=1387197 RepID=A0AB94ICE7_9GAMM|nr:efflux RND transporter periplasmic adaptor subunit [Candidatus Schmidhempelia bombi]TEA27090.1 biotin/lipoyl-binding protein [Candidatus Schmidhempelia bombi str. Bimp]